MAIARVIDVLQVLLRPPDEDSDGEVVQRYLTQRDEAAFVELVRRYGPMVYAACRRILNNGPEADDAFQATFFVLARKAATIRGDVGSWLYGVAIKVAHKARVQAVKRRVRQMAAAKPEAVYPATPEADLWVVLDEEFAKLPELLRQAVLVCDVNGKSRSQAAKELGWPEGTVAKRLAKAREQLAKQLTRRGITLSVSALSVMLLESATAAVPSALFVDTAQHALAYAGGSGGGSLAVQTLAEAVMRSFQFHILKIWAIVSLLVVALAGGSLMLAGGPGGKPEVPKVANIKRAAKVTVVSWQETKPIPFSNGPISNFAVSPDGKTIAVVVKNGMMHVIDAVTHAEIDPRYIPALKAPATKIGIAYGPKGRLAFTCQNGLVTLERRSDMSNVVPDTSPIFGLGRTLREGIPDFDPHQVVWVEDRYIVGEGRLLATNGVSFKEIGMTIVKKNGIDELKEVIGEQWESAATEKHQPTLLASAPGMDRVLYSAASKSKPFDIQVRMTDSKPHKIQTLSGHKALSTAGAVSPDGKFFLSGDDAGHLIAWEGEKFQKTQEWKLGGAIVHIAIASDNKTAAVLRRQDSKVGDAVSTDWELYLFDATISPAELTPFWKTSLEGIPRPASLAFHPDGTKLYGAFGERKPAGLRVWEKIPPNRVR